MIYAIVGKTSSGKDTIANYISQKYNIPIIVSHTTRPMRAYEQNGKQHWFNTKEEMQKLINQGGLIAYTKFPKTGYEYCATIADIPEGSDAIYIINPDGIRWFKEYGAETIDMKSIYVDLPEQEIVQRAKSRGDNTDTIFARLDSERNEMNAFRDNREYDVLIDNSKGLTTTLSTVDQFIEEIHQFALDNDHEEERV